jgi:hypothetical protein
MICYWDGWNRAHATRHGVTIPEIEYVVHHAVAPYPESIGGGKYLIRGQTSAGRYVQVIFAYTSTERMKFEEMSIDELLRLERSKGPYLYVIHARDLNEREKRRTRKRRH